MPTRIPSSPVSRNRPAFSLLELMVALTVAAALAVVAVPRIAGVVLKTKDTQCATNRILIERAEERYRADHDGLGSSGLEELRSARYLDRVPRCSAGGQYVWISTSAPVNMGCSVHEWPAQAQAGGGVQQSTATQPAPAPVPAVITASPFGSTLQEISKGFGGLMTAYRAKYKKWPSSKSPANFTDLGLAPSDWTVPVSHLYYAPAGSVVNIRPEAGWVISVTTTKGKSYTLTAAGTAALVYSAANDAWYYNSVSSTNLLDRSTIKTLPAGK